MLRTFCSNPALGGFGGGDESSSSQTASPSAATAPTPDAFCQIIKELVDNAVDACTVVELSSSSSTTTAKRVRVVIEQFQDDKDDDASSIDGSSSNKEILRVTVSDNGCGMNDIAKCVGAFHTSKAHNTATATATSAVGTTKTKKRKAGATKDSSTATLALEETNSSSSSSSSATATTEAQTAGRYGIGLTLCLLHAQRLVPNSCASIQSAVPSDKEWTVVAAVVDTASDAVRCLPRDSLKKRVAKESGTAISILVPGGPTATMAWPRLAEYFARFKLSLGMTCSLEVLAPTLSRVPLWVRPTTTTGNSTTSLQTKKPTKKTSKKKKARKKPSPTNARDNIYKDGNEKWYERLDSDTEKSDDSEEDSGRKGKGLSVATAAADQERIGIWKATQLFLGRQIDLENVAHVVVPIRAKKGGRGSTKKKNQASTGPKLEVDVIVHGPNEDEPDEYEIDENPCDKRTRSDDDESVDMFEDSMKKIDEGSSSSASMVLVRMVNKIPLLDSTEAVACGLVQGLASKKRMWNSFGLDVGLTHDPSNVGKLPTFEVRDSEQVAPFFKKGAHNLLEKDDDSDESDTEQEESGDESEDNELRGIKRKRQPKCRNLLPASVRLGNVLVIAQIHAEPTTLPLPTLSKGRLPIDNTAIDNALEVGLTKCLQQLQKTNPNLLLTASELRKAERDARYVPAVSLALASILTKSVTNSDPSIIERIRRWDSNRTIPANIVTMSDNSSANVADEQERVFQGRGFHSEDVESIGKLIEGRLRLVLSQPQKSNRTTTAKKKADEQEVEKESDTSEASSLDLHLPSVDIPWHLLDQDNDGSKKKSTRRDDLETPGDGMAAGSAKDANSSNSGEEYDDWL